MLHRGDCAAGLGGNHVLTVCARELTKPGRAGEGLGLGSANYKARLYLQRSPALGLSYVRQSQKAMKRRLPMARGVAVRRREERADIIADGLDGAVIRVERGARVEQLRGDLEGGQHHGALRILYTSTLHTAESHE